MPAKRPCTRAGTGSSAGTTSISLPPSRSDSTRRNSSATTRAMSPPARSSSAGATISEQPEEHLDYQLVETFVAVAALRQRLEPVGLGLQRIGLGRAAIRTRLTE